MEDLRPRFGARVRALRTVLGLSQEKLAERAELSWVYISGIERGLRNPSLNVIGQVAGGLGVTPDALLRAGDPPAGTPRPRGGRKAKSGRRRGPG